jgi:hypothetical protein
MGSCQEAPWDWPTSHSAVDRDRVRSRSTHTTSRSRVEGTNEYMRKGWQGGEGGGEGKVEWRDWRLEFSLFWSKP